MNLDNHNDNGGSAIARKSGKSYMYSPFCVVIHATSQFAASR